MQVEQIPGVALVEQAPLVVRAGQFPLVLEVVVEPAEGYKQPVLEAQ